MCYFINLSVQYREVHIAEKMHRKQVLFFHFGIGCCAINLFQYSGKLSIGQWFQFFRNEKNEQSFKIKVHCMSSVNFKAQRKIFISKHETIVLLQCQTINILFAQTTLHKWYMVISTGNVYKIPKCAWLLGTFKDPSNTPYIWLRSHPIPSLHNLIWTPWPSYILSLIGTKCFSF